MAKPEGLDGVRVHISWRLLRLRVLVLLACLSHQCLSLVALLQLLLCCCLLLPAPPARSCPTAGLSSQHSESQPRPVSALLRMLTNLDQEALTHPCDIQKYLVDQVPGSFRSTN
jgi:hypothetical protein